jgi:hypothetical protein
MGAPGCDDAPLVTVANGAAAKDITFVYPYYENPIFFRHQLGVWNGYDSKLAQHLSVIVVDDGSPVNPASGVIALAAPKIPLRLFRIGVDVRWNWLAARNIGAHHVPRESWFMMTDMDHVVRQNVLENLIYGRHSADVIYRFSRREHHGVRIHPHPNSWFMTREMFWKIGGYDENFSGFYGSDGSYRRRCAATALIRIMTDELERHEYVGDSSTTRYKRKQPEDARRKQIERGFPKGHKPKVLSFPFHEVTL